MTAAAGRAWAWVRSWGWRRPSDPVSPAEEFWEAQEKLQPAEGEVLRAGEQEPQRASRWWNKYLPTSYLWWPRKPEAGGLSSRQGASDADGELSDYGTPPPSPTPSSSPFRVFARSLAVDVLPEHYEICFNLLRHLFDLLVVGFLWTVSPPAKLALEVLGVQGALRLWLHGMAMFFVSTVGMAGLLWLTQEYLPQFALVYGVVQALVISVSVRQSVILGVDQEEADVEEKEDMDDSVEAKEQPVKTS